MSLKISILGQSAEGRSRIPEGQRAKGVPFLKKRNPLWREDPNINFWMCYIYVWVSLGLAYIALLASVQKKLTGLLCGPTLHCQTERANAGQTASPARIASDCHIWARRKYNGVETITMNLTFLLACVYSDVLVFVYCAVHHSGVFIYAFLKPFSSYAIRTSKRDLGQYPLFIYCDISDIFYIYML